jgi:dissimilatory sulfite reductase related protein
MPVVQFQDKTFDVDEEGFLKSFSDWSPEWVEYVKTIQGPQLITDEHWKLIHVLQNYYRENGRAPMVRNLSEMTGFKMKHIFELFPAGPGKGACKIAGLPKPAGCV